MSGLGGGGAMVLYRAREDRYEVIDYGMRAPRSLRRRGLRGSASLPLLAFVQGLAGECPADRAVAQRTDRIGKPRVDQRLRADDAAGAARAIDDHAGFRARCEIGDAKHEFRAGTTDRGRDAHGLVFVKTTRVNDHDVRPGVDQRLHILGAERRRVPDGLNQFAKGLARDIDVAKNLAAGCDPALQTVTKHRDVRVAQRPQAHGGKHRVGIARPCVEGDDGHIATG